jgi:transposase-like protein
MEPTTLQEAIIYFSDPANCREWIIPRRWPNGVECPRCGSKKVTFLEKYNRWQCGARHASRQFTVKTGTIFEDSPISLDKWLAAMWQVVNDRNGISSYEVHRMIGVSQKTAWFMDHRIRLALQDDLTGGMLGGEVEVDESFIGGKVRNMHKDRKNRVQAINRNTGNKAIVLGILERASEGKKRKRVRATVISDRKGNTMKAEIAGIVEPGATIHADEFSDTWRMDDKYTHQIVNHLQAYVNGNVHTNGLENFWSLLKRGIGGTYVSVEPFHLFRYVDEQAFRFNNRKDADGVPLKDFERFDLAVRQIVGKRLTWDRLTGKESEMQPSC